MIGMKVKALIGLGAAVAIAAAGYWVWTELKEFGLLSERAEQQEVMIANQHATIGRLREDMQRKDAALQTQTERTQHLLRNTRLQQLAVQEARKHANEALRNCLDMRIADGMRFGPSRENGVRDSEARSDVGTELPDSDT